MIIKKNFLKDIPKEKRDIVLKKIYTFNEQLLKFKNYKEMPKGSGIRQVEGTNRFKFRINNGDRVVFCYDKSIVENQTSIIFIAYANHDKQILAAKNKQINVVIQESDFNINTEIDGDGGEEFIDKDYFNDNIYEDISELNSIILEDEYICLLIDENDEDYLKYLSEEQYDCLRVFNKPIFITGSAGSGKSIIGIRKMIMNAENGIYSTYITYSSYLKNNSEMQFNKVCNTVGENIIFTTINELCCNLINIQEITPVDFVDFKEWIKNTETLNHKLHSISYEEIWYEIANKIKGTKGSSFISKDEYLQLAHYYDQDIKCKIYNIAKLYNKWLSRNNYMDENDLAFKAIEALSNGDYRKYDFLVIDEMQDMSNKQLELILKLCNNKNVLFIWDENQITRYNDFNIGKVKSNFYSGKQGIIEKILTKNYRNNKEIELLSRKILEIKNKYSESIIDNSNIKPMRDGKKPIVLKCEKEEIRELLKEVDNQSDSAIIVWDEDEKQKLKEISLPVGRVFTVNEIKGLDYKTIICLNIIDKLNEYTDSLQELNKTNSSVIIQKINSIYVAITRARNVLCIIEEDNNKFLKNLEEFLEVARTVDYNKLEIDKVFSEDMWINEGEKLESAKKYHQAAEAYRKAGLEEKAKICEDKIVRRKREMDNRVKATAIRIESVKDLKFSTIKRALELVLKAYKITFDNYVELVVRIKPEGCQLIQAHIDEEQNKTTEISNLCKNLLESKKHAIASKKKITIHACLIKDGEVQELSSILRSDKDTIIVDISTTGRISINSLKTKTDEQKSMESLLEFFESKTVEEEVKEDNYDMKSFMKADEYFSKGEYSSATKYYEEALNQKNISLLTKSIICSALSGCKLHMEEYDDAIFYAQLAIEYNSFNTDAYSNLGTGYLNIGEFEKALESYMKLGNQDRETLKESINKWKIQNSNKLIDNDYNKINIDKIFDEIGSSVKSNTNKKWMSKPESAIQLLDIRNYLFLNGMSGTDFCDKLQQLLKEASSEKNELNRIIKFMAYGCNNVKNIYNLTYDIKDEKIGLCVREIFDMEYENYNPLEALRKLFELNKVTKKININKTKCRPCILNPTTTIRVGIFEFEQEDHYIYCEKKTDVLNLYYFEGKDCTNSSHT